MPGEDRERRHLLEQERQTQRHVAKDLQHASTRCYATAGPLCTSMSCVSTRALRRRPSGGNEHDAREMWPKGPARSSCAQWAVLRDRNICSMARCYIRHRPAWPSATGENNHITRLAINSMLAMPTVGLFFRESAFLRAYAGGERPRAPRLPRSFRCRGSYLYTRLGRRKGRERGGHWDSQRENWADYRTRLGIRASGRLPSAPGKVKLPVRRQLRAV